MLTFCHSRADIRPPQFGDSHAPIPNEQRSSDPVHQHTFLTLRWCKCIISGRLQQHPNSENGSLVRSHIQWVYTRATCLFLYWDVERFWKIVGNAFHDVTNQLVLTEYFETNKTPHNAAHNNYHSEWHHCYYGWHTGTTMICTQCVLLVIFYYRLQTISCMVGWFVFDVTSGCQCDAHVRM